MNKRNVIISDLKFNLELMVKFLEDAKPCLTSKEYAFYKKVINEIDLKRNITNINCYIDFVMERILQTSLRFYG